jgi:CSLREA domain-containing protein
MACFAIGWARRVGAAVGRMLAAGRNMPPRRAWEEDTLCAPLRLHSRFHAAWCFGVLIACVPALGITGTFMVNSAADVPDANAGDGICRTAPDNTVCTLRAAIMEANLSPGADTIVLQANTTYLLSRVGNDDAALNGDLDVFDSLTITGAGPESTIIDGNGAATGDRVMTIFKCIGNAPLVMGLCPGGADVVVAISGVALQHGKPVGLGGGIYNGGKLTLENCAISDNSNVDNGAGIYSAGTLTLLNSTIRHNTTTGGSFSYGGGLFLSGVTATTITGSTISGNRADLGGGGIYSDRVALTVVNSTISGNSTSGYGGGLVVDKGTAGLYNVTIAANEANADASGGGIGGGVYNDKATVTLNDSILTANTHRIDGSLFIALSDCSGTFVSQGNNIVTNATGCSVNPPASAVPASLGPLQNNGGPTLTHALMAGSKAIDAGNLGGCTDNLGAPITIDQRGEPRSDGACDLGAYELHDIIFQSGFDP